MTEHDPLTGLRPTPLPEHLRGRVLSAARSAVTAAPRRAAWSRAAGSPGLRFAWAAACLLLVAGHLLLGLLPARPGSGRSAARVPVGEALTLDARWREELREILALPRVGEPLPLPGEARAPTADPKHLDASLDVIRKG